MMRVEVQHIVPVDDVREHETGREGCWCDYTTEEVAPGMILIIHAAGDARELIEAHGIN